MKIIHVTDKYNPNKVWVIKITKCYHYLVNQMIKGRMFNKKFTRMRKKDIKELFEGTRN
jgi:hypothetical protein